jgi:hypothetical protein
MDSIAQTALRDSEIINETASTGDAWIRQRKEHMRAQKLSTKTKSLSSHKSSTKLLPRVMHGFQSTNNPWASQIINKTAFMGDSWIRQRKQP